ncbi:hypothetical protein AVEN_131257-1 [Araneus ventricosus]|uniref:Uncharacterized protein n=1 Tax=Araneus ventricosus TaxID=182803 RepID=A0A4Y2LUX4_ARAVE|nr:hypothetical protein AVEN_131257-1 [Araneus ventricosus]
MDNRKPDLIAKKDGKILVIDAQIVGEAVDLERANNRKISYYRDNVELDLAIQVQHGSPNINYLSATLLGSSAHRGSFSVGLNSNNIDKVHLSQEVAPTLPSVRAVSSACPTVGVTPLFRCDAYAQESRIKIGLGVHKRRKHAVDANSDIDTVLTKSRWSEEEALMLAKAEAELIKRGGVRFMNQELEGQDDFPAEEDRCHQPR